MEYDLELAAKRKYRMDSIKREFVAKKITLAEAKKRIFPLIGCALELVASRS